jgi:hypothetical protein
MVVLFTGGISLVRGDVGFLHFKIGDRKTKKKRRLSRKTKSKFCGNQAFSRITLFPKGNFRRFSKVMEKSSAIIKKVVIQKCPTLGGLGKSKTGFNVSVVRPWLRKPGGDEATTRISKEPR